jgi:hypothetical protein
MDYQNYLGKLLDLIFRRICIFIKGSVNMGLMESFAKESLITELSLSGPI